MQRIKKKNKNCRHCSESQWGHFQGQTSQTQKNIQFTVIEDSENCYRIFFPPFFFFFLFYHFSISRGRKRYVFGLTIIPSLWTQSLKSALMGISSNLVQMFTWSQRWSDEILAAKIHISRSLWPPEKDNKALIILRDLLSPWCSDNQWVKTSSYAGGIFGCLYTSTPQQIQFIL